MKGRTQEERSAATVRHVLAVAEEHFAAVGYEATSTEALVRKAGLTRGALYYHFGNKRGLFEAVVKDVQNRLAQAVTLAGAAERDPWAAFVGGCHTWLETATEPAVRQILLLDAPAVLGWERWLALDAVGGSRLLREGVAELVADGDIGDVHPEALTQLLNGAMNQAALWVAHAEHRDVTLKAAKLTLERLLEGLKRAADRPLLEQPQQSVT